MSLAARGRGHDQCEAGGNQGPARPGRIEPDAPWMGGGQLEDPGGEDDIREEREPDEE